MLLVFFGVLLWSGIGPYDYFTWFAEVIPGVLALALFGLTYKKLRFTDFAYFVIFLHCLLLFVGGHYTYARVPLFTDIAEILGTGRNSYDKVGHLFQGFTPVLVAREFLIRKNILGKGFWNSLFALATSTGAADFLGTQGYVWDTQADMFWALIGGVVMLLFFTKIHDKSISKSMT